MRIKLLAAAGATVLLVATAAVILSCQDGTTAPTALKCEAPSLDVIRIWGYVTDIYNEPVPDAYVEWWCETCDMPIGEDAVDDLGR